MITMRETAPRGGRATARPISVLASARARPGAEERLKTAALALVAPSRAEDGNINYDLHQGLDETTIFILYGTWESREAIDLHIQSAHFQGFLAATKDWLDGPFQVTLLDQISEPRRYKTARTRVPNTAEFRPYREAAADPAKSALMERAAEAIGRAVDEHPDQAATGLTPDELYDSLMARPGLGEDWERAFGSGEPARVLFGLVAWTHFFDHGTNWLATPPDTPGVGKRGWTFLPASAASTLVPSPPAPAAGFAIGQCVLWKLRSWYGRIASEPRDKDDTLIPEREYRVRFPSYLGADNYKWIGERSLGLADSGRCAEADADPVR